MTAITRTQAKGVHKDLPDGGVWRTINGHHIYIKDGKVLAGAIPGVTGAKKATKAHLKEHQEHVDKEAKGKGTKTDAKPKSAKKVTTKPSATTTGVRRGTSKPAPTATTKPKPGAKTTADKKPTAKKVAPKKSAVAPKAGVKNATTTKGAKASGTATAKTDAKGNGKSLPKPKTTAKATTSKPKGKTAKTAVKDIRSDVQKNRDIAYDVGDKIGGARKDEFSQSFAMKPTLQNLEKLEKVSPELAQKLVTKKNLLGSGELGINFDQERKNGSELKTAMLKGLIYDRIAPKPQADTPEGRKAYLDAFQKIQRHIGGIKDFDQLRDSIRELSNMANRVESMKGAEAQLERSKRLKELQGSSFGYINEEYYQKQVDAGKEASKFMDFDALGEKFNNLLTSYKARERTFDTLNKKLRGKTWDNYNDASEEKKTATPKPKGEGEKKKWERKAEAKDLRTGGRTTAVTKPEHMLKDFGLRGVEFGNWVDDSSGKYHMKRCAESFHDLSDVLGVSDKDVSFNGRLAIAFGARGKAGALAHYESSKKVINMTKYGGAGSLAHEWGHAMDNILYQYSHDGAGSLNFGSNGGLGDKDPKLKELYQNVVNSLSSPVEGSEGAHLKVAVDSSDPANRQSRYYPKLRNIIQNNPTEAGMQEALKAGIKMNHDTLTSNVDRYKRIMEQYPAGHPRRGDLEKTIKKAERTYDQDMEKLPHMLAQDYKRSTGKDYKGSLNVPTFKSEYHTRMKSLDNGKEGKYWSSPVEMFARVFESYVQDKLGSKKQYNNYLVHGTTESAVKEVGAPFPIGAERKEMFKHMDALLKHVSKNKLIAKALRMELRKSLGLESSEAKRNAYGVDWTSFDDPVDGLLYIPVNRLRTPYQTEQATNADKVAENVAKMRAGQPLAPIVIGADYDVHDGHHRLLASEEVGYTHIPCVLGVNLSDVERDRAREAYEEVWKSFTEADHPRAHNGEFSKVYHLTSNPDFKFDATHSNRQQELGAGLYTSEAQDVEDWHRHLQNPETRERHKYVRPLDVSNAKILHDSNIPRGHELARHLISAYGSGAQAVEALKQEIKDYVGGDTFGEDPMHVAQKRLYAKSGGYDGIASHDPQEGQQIILFDDKNVSYEPNMTIDEFVQHQKHHMH
jgi:hypothetical protein